MNFEPGTTLGRYEVRAFLDAGGMGEVYSAFDPRLERQVAIKVLPESLAQSPDFRLRFSREMQVISRLNHKNICTVFDTGTFEERPYFVMEFMQGQTLESLLRSESIEIEHVLHIGIQVASALSAAHREGIIHRDIKSSNIFVNNQGDAKVLDFGIARFVQTGLETDSGTAGRITSEHSPVGSVAFMSPEQARGEEVDGRSDVYSLGVVLYELATGVTPYRGTITATLGQLVSSDPVARPRTLNPAVPSALERIICRALEKNKQVRYQTAADLLAALRGLERDRVLDSGTIERGVASQSTGMKTSSSRRRGAMYGAGTAVLIIAAIFLAFSRLGPLLDRAPKSIAVLPCGAQEAVDGTEQRCDILASRLIAAFSGAAPQLTVLDYPVVEPYAESDLPVQEIGNELNVDAVVTFRLRTEGTGTRIFVNVMDTRTGRNIYADTWHEVTRGSQRSIENIADGVAEGVLLRLSEEDRERWAIEQKFQNAEYEWRRRTAQSLRAAAGLFREVISENPQHARAHAGLANTYIMLHYYAGASSEESYPRAKAAAEASLELNGSLAESHAALGLVLRDYELDFSNAEIEFQRALQLDSRSELVLQWYAELLAMTSRFSKAEELILRAEAVAPVDDQIQAVHGWILLAAGDVERARIQLQTALAMDPESTLANWFLGQLFFAQGKYAEAAETLKRAVEISGDSPRFVADYASALAMVGNRAESLNILADLETQLAAGSDDSSYESAIIYAALGNLDQAFVYLEAALDEGTWQVAYMKVDPMLGPLRLDSRFGDLLLRAGFPADAARSG